jgi:hypothetical protein
MLTIVEWNLTLRGTTEDTFDPTLEELETQEAHDAPITPRQYHVNVNEGEIGVRLNPLDLPIKHDVQRAFLMTGTCIKVLVAVYHLVATLVSKGRQTDTIAAGESADFRYSRRICLDLPACSSSPA